VSVNFITLDHLGLIPLYRQHLISLRPTPSSLCWHIHGFTSPWSHLSHWNRHQTNSYHFYQTCSQFTVSASEQRL